MRAAIQAGSVGITVGPSPDIGKCGPQTSQSPEHSTHLVKQLHADDGTTNHPEQRDTVGQISRLSDATGHRGDDHLVTDMRSDRVVRLVGPRSAAKHLRQLLPATPPLFMATPTPSLLDFDQSPTIFQRPNGATDGDQFIIHAYQRLSGAVSSKGRNLLATASRARKMRERTVPIGQFMISAISS